MLRSRKILLSLIQTYVDHTELPKSTLSKRLFGRSNKIERMDADQEDIMSDTIDEIIKKLSSVWPSDLPWPDNIKRPLAEDA